MGDPRVLYLAWLHSVGGGQRRSSDSSPALGVYVPLLPLALLLVTGLYLVVLPYAAGRRSGRRMVLEK